MGDRITCKPVGNTVVLENVANIPLHGTILLEIVDRSPDGTLSDYNSSVQCSRPMTLRDGSIDVSGCERSAIDGKSLPTLEDVEIVE